MEDLGSGRKGGRQGNKKGEKKGAERRGGEVTGGERKKERQKFVCFIFGTWYDKTLNVHKEIDWYILIVRKHHYIYLDEIRTLNLGLMQFNMT